MQQLLLLLLLVVPSSSLNSISEVKNSMSNLPVNQKDGYAEIKNLALWAATTYSLVPLTQCAIQCENSSSCLEKPSGIIG